MPNDIFHLIRDGNEQTIRKWLDNVENDFNICDDHGFTLLHWLAWDGHLEIVDMLVQRGAKVNALNNCEDTPLHCAVQRNHYHVAVYLIKQKADVNAVNLHGNTPLHYAAHFSYMDLALELINMGALLMVCNRYEQTPLDLAKEPLPAQLLNMAKIKNQNLTNRITQHITDENWRASKSKSLFIDSNSTTGNTHQTTGIDIAELSTQFIISSNHSGQTWKGMWQGKDVIIKILRKKDINQRIINNFNQEYKKLRIFNCPHVLPVIASCVSIPHLIIVSKYLPYGSLFNILHDETGLAIDPIQGINFAIDIVKGMAFLHQLDTPVQNFYLNSKHVLIDEDLGAKVNMADYTFTFCDRARVHSPAWMSPESLKKKPDEINRQSVDMWSFGIILWELHTKQIPFHEYTPMQCGLAIANEGLRIQLPADMSPQMQKLIRICMNEDASKRPKFDMILPILEKLKK